MCIMGMGKGVASPAVWVVILVPLHSVGVHVTQEYKSIPTPTATWMPSPTANWITFALQGLFLL